MRPETSSPAMVPRMRRTTNVTAVSPAVRTCSSSSSSSAIAKTPVRCASRSAALSARRPSGPTARRSGCSSRSSAATSLARWAACSARSAARMPGSRAAPVIDGPSDPREAPVEHQHVAIGGEPPAAAQGADQGPVQRARVLSAPLPIRPAERAGDGPPDLLVEEDRPGRPVDAEVRPDPQLAQVARAAVGLERALEVVVAGPRPRRDDLAVAELELDPVDVDARGRRAHRETDAPARARLVRAGEDLAARHVAL